MSAVAYRYEDRRYVGIEEDDRGSVRVNLIESAVIKTTPKGFWIDDFMGGKRFVLKCARKQFACLTKADALASFRARKKRQIQIYTARLDDAKEALRLSNEISTA